MPCLIRTLTRSHTLTKTTGEGNKQQNKEIEKTIFYGKNSTFKFKRT